MSEPTATLDGAITAFAAAVRRHLDDLTAEDVDDLTGGLEADLIEQASDEEGNLHLDDPAAYAAELRASAGLPPRGDSTAPFHHRVARGLESFGAATRQSMRSSRLGAWLTDFALSLRPVWWVFRGWAVYQLLAAFVFGQNAVMPPGLSLWALLFATIVLSVQWGRGRWAQGGFLTALRVAVSAIVIVAAPFLAGWALNETNAAAATDYGVSYTDPTGLWLDGQRVTNIFGYDSEGNPISELQLFDQNGNPLVTVGDSLVDSEYDYSTDGNTATVPFENGTPGMGWNIYPLNEAPLDEMGNVDANHAAPATPPFRATYPVPGASTPTATPEPTPTPTAGPDSAQ